MEQWWVLRDTGIQKAWDSWDNHHRTTLPTAVRNTGGESLYELGCGPGPNLRLLRAEFPSMPLGGCDINARLTRWATEHLGTPIECAPLPVKIGPEWEITLSCYTLAYCPRDVVVEQLASTDSQHLILMEPWGNGEVKQKGEESVPRFYHAWHKLLPDTGWSIMWRWPIAYIDDLQVLTVASRKGF